MKVVIDIPEDQYRTLTAKTQADVVAAVDDRLLITAIKNGIPIPKGHGRLIDAGKLLKFISNNAHPIKCDTDTNQEIIGRGMNMVEIGMSIQGQPTIIWADNIERWEKEDGSNKNNKT